MYQPQPDAEPDADGGYICPCQFVRETVAIRIRVDPESLSGLNTVMLVERVVRELSQRHDVSGLMKGADHEARGIRGA